MSREDEEIDGVESVNGGEPEDADSGEDIGTGVFEDGDSGEATSGKFDKVISDGTKKYKLSGMYREWFLDYASYVILERAVPHIEDGLKPVQRRILHAMKEEDDGRFNKVASLVGATMPYHLTGTLPLRMPSSSSDRRTCSSTVRVTGAISSPVIRPLPAGISRPG